MLVYVAPAWATWPHVAVLTMHACLLKLTCPPPWGGATLHPARAMPTSFMAPAWGKHADEICAPCCSGNLGHAESQSQSSRIPMEPRSYYLKGRRHANERREWRSIKGIPSSSNSIIRCTWRERKRKLDQAAFKVQQEAQLSSVCCPQAKLEPCQTLPDTARHCQTLTITDRH